MKTLALKPIYSTEVLNVWPLVEGLITKSLKHADDKYSIYDIKYCLIKKEMQLWTIVDCSGNIKSTIVTSIADYPNKRVLFMRFIAGEDFESWQHFIDDFKEFAKLKGCHSIDGFGRPGWEPKIKKIGFKKISVIYSLPIEGNRNGKSRKIPTE